jgi:TAT (twin-arginine translocation) pathway signal sequence
MSEHFSSPQISRRSLLRGGAAAAAVAVVGLPLSSCTTGPGGTSASSSTATTPPSTTTPRSTGQPSGAGVANIHVSRDHYGVHIEPSVAVNPRHPRQLLAACQVAPQLQNPQLIATYLSVDAGATWERGALPQAPAGQAPASDDVTVAFDPQGRGYLCASRADNTPGGRALFVWRTDDGGRSFSAPATLLPIGQYFDHPWIAAVAGQTPSKRNVYIAWAGGAGGNRSDLGFTRSTDGGMSFESPRTILTDNRHSDSIGGPRLAAGMHGLVCVVCSEAAHQDSSGDTVAQMVAVCSTDAGQNFAAPVPLGTGSPRISLPGGVIANGSDPTVAAIPHGDALYAAYTTHQPGATHSDIVVTASADHGRTWTKPVTATPHDDVTYFQPNLTVDEAGRVAISAFALAHEHVNQVLLLSKPHQLRFQAPLQVTTTAFDPLTGTLSFPKHGAWWIGDYQGITTNAEAFHLIWNDTRTGKLDLFAATVHP